jgi:hypothetical protein
MTNLDVYGKKPGKFVAAYEKAKASRQEKKPFNTSKLSLNDQLKNFQKTSFSDEDIKALHEDMLSV